MSHTEEFLDPSSDHPRRFLGEWGTIDVDDVVEIAAAAGYVGIVKTPQIESMGSVQERYEKRRARRVLATFGLGSLKPQPSHEVYVSPKPDIPADTPEELGV